MKSILVFGLVFLGFSSFAQIPLRVFDSATVGFLFPPTESYVRAFAWVDRAGGQILVLSATRTQDMSEDSSISYKAAGLHARHYHAGEKIDSTHMRWIMDWQIRDTVPPCEFDIICEFIPGSVQVTDLNKDGTSELWLMYRLVCTSDVSPIPTKEIMYENGIKHAVRGTSRVKDGLNSYVGGEYHLDDSYKLSPPEFQQFAISHWNEFNSYSPVESH